MSCPRFEQLIDFLEGRLDLPASAEVAGHLKSGCPKCSGERSWYEHLRSIANRDTTFTPPAEAHRDALQLFERNIAAGWDQRAINPVLAQLGFDSMKDQARSGARSAEIGVRELVYTAEGFSIDLQIGQKGPALAEVIGQILREGEQGFASVSSILVDLTQKAESVWSTVTNEVGEFMMTGVDCGEYGLIVDTADTRIRIASIPIRF